MILTDNTKHVSSEDNIEEYMSLSNIANRTISELLDGNDNDILIYPHSLVSAKIKLVTNIYFRYIQNGKRKNVQKLYWKLEMSQAL